MRSKKVKVGDLKDQIGMAYPRPILFCRYCGNENSANKADYFGLPPSYVFQCCGKPMSLVVKRQVYEQVA